MSQTFVAGFLFRADRKEVALIRKRKPEWQFGKLNAVGGKVEAGETEYAAMVREFREEAGATVRDWSPVCVLTCGDAVVHFFRSFSGDDVAIESKTPEDVGWFAVGEDYGLIPNLKWLIPMAADLDLPCGEVKSGFSCGSK